MASFSDGLSMCDNLVVEPPDLDFQQCIFLGVLEVTVSVVVYWLVLCKSEQCKLCQCILL